MDKPFRPRACSRKSRHFRRICRTDLRLGHPRRKNTIQTGNSVSEEQLNQLIQRTYQVTEEKAEEIINYPQKPSDYQASVANYFNQQITKEIQRVLQFYYTTQTADDMTDIKNILLTGEAARQEGIAQTVASQTNADVQCVHPARYFADNLKTDKQQFEHNAPTLDQGVRFGSTGIIIMNNLIKINLLPTGKR